MRGVGRWPHASDGEATAGKPLRASESPALRDAAPMSHAPSGSPAPIPVDVSESRNYASNNVSIKCYGEVPSPPRERRWTCEKGKAAGMQEVLVVEDDDAIRRAVRLTLEDEGYEVYEAPDGKPALERLQNSQNPMVVVLDLIMPGMDGRQVLEAVAGHDALATRHAYILVTANAKTLPLSFATLLTDLRVPVIAKPFDLDKLVDIVAEAAQRLTSN
jgi:CheY-like chemotaxis protein